MKASIRRVLIVHPYGLGDLLFITPVLRALRLLPCVEKVDLLLGSRSDVIAKNNPHIDEIFTVDKDKIQSQKKMASLKELWRLGQKLRQNRYDLLLDYSLRGEYAFWGAFFLGIRRRAGFNYKRRGFFHNLRLPIPQGFSQAHVVDYVCNLAEAAGIPVEDRFLEYYVTEKDDSAAAEILRQSGILPNDRVIVLSPGGGESWGKDAHFKQWPPAYFVELMKFFKKEIPASKFLILGGPKDKVLGDQMSGPEIQAMNFCGQIPLTISAALIARSDLVVGNDGGLIHLAVALKRPVVALYGPVAPEVYGPYPRTADSLVVFKGDLECRPCYHRFRYNSSCPDRACLQQLRPDEVIRQMNESKILARMKT